MKKKLISSLDIQRNILKNLIAEIDRDIILWNPQGKWSIADILNHLVYEERFDFRVRLISTLEDSEKKWESIDPVGYIQNSKRIDIDRMLEEFDDERNNSIALLNDLRELKWAQSYEHPQLGLLSAGDIAAAWCAHDLKHIHQIISIVQNYTLAELGPYDPRYAG